MTTIGDYTLYRELRREGVPLANSAELGDGVAAALWERHDTALTRYEDPNHHTLSLYVAGGDRIRWKRGREWVANDGAGTICVLPHAQTTEWLVDGWISLFHLYIPRTAFDRAIVETIDADPARVDLTERIYFHDGVVEGMVRACAAILAGAEDGDRIALGHAARALTALLVQRFTNRQPGASRAIGGLSPAACRRLVDFIEARLDAPLTLDDLAAVVGLSPFHFAHVFKRTMGEAPHRFVTRRRIDRAKDLLTQGMPAAETAIACGFSGQSHFTQRFRALTGTTPAAFARARHGALSRSP